MCIWLIWLMHWSLLGYFSVLLSESKSSLTQTHSLEHKNSGVIMNQGLHSQLPTVIYLADSPDLVCFQQISSCGMYQEDCAPSGNMKCIWFVNKMTEWEVMSVLIRRSKTGYMSSPTEILTLQTRATRDSTPLSMVFPSRDASRKKK